MSNETNKLQVGLFVLVAGGIALGAAIWLGATRFLDETETFVTYFSESVQGLDPGSAVKYRGVPAGRVGSIHIAPDGELIEVLLDIDNEMALHLRGDASLRAKLELAGITGLRYIEIEPRSGELLAQAPNLRFTPEYELIPSARSSFLAVQQALGDVYDKAMQLDLKAISDDVRQTLQTAQQLMSDARIGRMLDNLEKTSSTTVRLSSNLDEITEDLDLGPVVANAAEATREAKVLFTSLNRLANEDVARATEELTKLAQNAQQIVAGMQYTLDRLERTVGSLRDFSEEVRTQPSLLFFSDPPADDRPAEEEP